MRNLITIIKYESLMLFRTWKFWILVIVGAFFPIMFNVVFIIVRRFGEDAGWAGLDGAGPYVLFYYFNIFQIAIVIFLTGDFREKDVKMKVVEVMNSRSMTNFEYIFGKYIGIIVPLISLTTIIILILSIVNYFINDIWLLRYYATNFLILNIPSLLFITALCIFVSALLRNSFVVFIVILSYTVGTVILLSYTTYPANQMWLYLDYVGFYLPLFPSDLVGILNLNQIIMQRIFYILLGGLFFGLTVVLFYPRLHQSNFWANMTSFGSLGSVFAAGLIFYNAWNVESEKLELQKAVVSESLIETPGTPFRITEYSMHYKLFKDEIPIKAKVEVAVTKEAISETKDLLFVLNPGLKIIRITDWSGRELVYNQKNIEILITLAENIGLQESKNIIFEFEGDIDSRVVYLNRKANDPGELDKQNGIEFVPNAIFPNEPVLLNRKYSYLVPESFWYPQLNNPYMYHFPDKKPVMFFTGEWSFEVPADLTAIAPGTLIASDSSSSNARKTFRYKTEIPIRDISLVTGDYQSYTTSVLGTDIKFFVSSKHSGIADFFGEIKEDVNTVLTDAMRGINEVTGLEYPHSSLSYVEIPLTFQWYRNEGVLTESIVQEAIVFLPEYMVATTFKESFDRDKRRAEQRGEAKSEAELKKQLFIDLIVNRMFGTGGFFRQGRNRPTPVANFWSRRINFVGELYPVYEHYFDRFLQELISNEINFFVTNQPEEFNFEDIGNGFNWSAWQFERTYGVNIDTMYRYVRTVPLSKMRPSSENEIYNGMMMFKGAKINYILKEVITTEKYKEVLQRFIKEYAYKTATIQDFQRICEEVHGESLDWYFSNWLNGTAFPGYEITAFDTYKLRGGSRGVQYLVELNVKNSEKDDGFLGVTLKSRDDQVVKRTPIRGFEELQFSFLVNDYPEEITVNPIFSQNQNILSRKVHVPDEFESRQVRDGIRAVNSVNIENEGIVIDDLDPGFSVINLIPQQYFRPKSERVEWRIQTNSGAFGKYKFTYRRKNKGTGQILAQWKTDLPEPGVYDVQVYIFKGEGNLKIWNERNVATEFIYTVNHGEGSDEIILSWHAETQGWTSLGRYYFNGSEEASVVLSDKGNGRVLADAVRFIPINPNNTPRR